MCKSEIFLQCVRKSQQDILCKRSSYDLQTNRQSGFGPAARYRKRGQSKKGHGRGRRHVFDDARHWLAIDQQNIALRIWKGGDAGGRADKYVVCAEETGDVAPNPAALLFSLEIVVSGDAGAALDVPNHTRRQLVAMIGEEMPERAIKDRAAQAHEGVHGAAKIG